jgi:hypothetical protein
MSPSAIQNKDVESGSDPRHNTAAGDLFANQQINKSSAGLQRKTTTPKVRESR